MTDSARPDSSKISNAWKNHRRRMPTGSGKRLGAVGDGVLLEWDSHAQERLIERFGGAQTPNPRLSGLDARSREEVVRRSVPRDLISAVEKGVKSPAENIDDQPGNDSRNPSRFQRWFYLAEDVVGTRVLVKVVLEPRPQPKSQRMQELRLISIMQENRC